MQHPAPVRIDASLVSLRNKPLADDPDPQGGPVSPPGDYRIEFAVGSTKVSAAFKIERDPRLTTPIEGHRRQFDLLRDLTQSLSLLNQSVNRIRRLRRQLECPGFQYLHTGQYRHGPGHCLSLGGQQRAHPDFCSCAHR